MAQASNKQRYLRLSIAIKLSCLASNINEWLWFVMEILALHMVIAFKRPYLETV